MALEELTYEIGYNVDDSGLAKSMEDIAKIDTAWGNIMAKVNGVNSAWSKINTSMGSTSSDGLSNSLKKTADSMNEVVSKASEHERISQMVNNYVDNYNSKLDKSAGLGQELDSRIGEVYQSSSKVSEEIQKVIDETTGAASAEDKFSSSANEASNNIEKSTTKANELKNSLSGVKTVSNGISSILGAWGIIGIGNGLVSGIKSAISAFSEFQQEMATVHATLGDVTNNDLTALSNKALEISNKYGLASLQISQGEEELASHGLNAKQIMDTIQPSVLLAVAGNIKMKDSTLDVSSALRNYNLDMSKAGHIADVYSAVAASTAAAMPNMAEALKNVAPIAGEVGISFENTAAAIGALADKGIKGGIAGTDLKIMMERLITPVGKGATLISELGFKAIDPTTHKMKDMGTIVRDLDKAFESHGLTTAPAKNSALSIIFGKEALPGTAALFGTAPKQIDDLTKSLQNSDGAAKKMTDTMNDTLAGAFRKLKTNVQNAFITNIDKTELGYSLKEFVVSVNKDMPAVSSEIGKLLDTAVRVGSGIKQNWGGISSIILGVATAFLTLKGAMAIESAIKTLGGLSKALPTVAAAAGIGLIAAGFMEIHNGNTGLGDLLVATGVGMAAVRIGIKGISSAGIGLVAYGFLEIQQGNTGLGSLLLGTGAGLIAIQKGLKTGAAVALLGMAFAEIKEGNKGLGALLIGTAAGLMVVNAAGGWVGLAIGVLAAGAALIMENWKPISQFFVGTWDVIKQSATNGVNWVIEKINGAISAINKIIETVDKIPGIKISTIQAIQYVGDKEKKTKSGSTEKSGKSSIAAIPMAANGMTNSPGGTTLVGEKGPELVNLPKGANVIPNKQTSSMIGGNYSSMGLNIGVKMSSGIMASKSMVDTSTNKLIADNKALISNYVNSHTIYGQNSMKNLGTAITNKEPLVTTATTKVSTDNKQIMNTMALSGLTYGSDMVGELGNGVKARESDLLSIVNDLATKVVNQFKTTFGIHSPSKVMYKIGDFLGQGLINGMQSNDINSFIGKWIGDTGSLTKNGMGGIIGEILQPMFSKGDNKGIISMVYNLMHGGIGSLFGGAAASGNVAQWIMAAMGLTGAPADWLAPLEQIAMGESGGDPMNINTYDINAQEGHPSMGLMQLIQENMDDWHLPGMTDMFNPIENAAAAIRLIQHQYGSPYNTPGIRSMSHGGPYMGYANGTDNSTPGMHWVGEKGPELLNFKGGETVTPADKSANIAKQIYANSSNNKGTSIVSSPTFVININGTGKDSKNIANDVDRVLREKFGKYFDDKMKILAIQTGLSEV